MTAHTPAATRIVWAQLDVDSRKKAIASLSGMTVLEMASVMGTTDKAIYGFMHRQRSERTAARVTPMRWVPKFKVHAMPAEEAWAALQGPRLPNVKHTCQWPGHDGPCGLPVSRKSYCATHLAMAYRPAAVRERAIRERSPVLPETELRAVERVAFGRREVVEVEE